MLRSRSSNLSGRAFLAVLLCLPACSGGEVTVSVAAVPVSFSVAVADSFGIPFEGVEVRILQAWTEWAGRFAEPLCGCGTAFTDRYGHAVFSGYDLARADLGFPESADGAAVLLDDATADEALVDLLVGAPSLGWYRVRVPLSFDAPDVHVDIEIAAP